MAKEGIIFPFLWFFDPMPIRRVESAFEGTSSQKVNSITKYMISHIMNKIKDSKNKKKILMVLHFLGLLTHLIFIF